jgi:hypothetical protein
VNIDLRLCFNRFPYEGRMTLAGEDQQRATVGRLIASTLGSRAIDRIDVISASGSRPERTGVCHSSTPASNRIR